MRIPKPCVFSHGLASENVLVGVLPRRHERFSKAFAPKPVFSRTNAPLKKYLLVFYLDATTDFESVLLPAPRIALATREHKQGRAEARSQKD